MLAEKKLITRNWVNTTTDTEHMLMDFKRGCQVLYFFYCAFHHVDVPSDMVICNFPLGKFVKYKRKNHTPEQKEILDMYGFIWDLHEYKFNIYLELLKEFKKEYGHLYITKDVVYKGEQLGEWCDHIRHNRRTLAPDRELILANEGFIWNIDDEKFRRKLDIIKFLLDSGIRITKGYIYNDEKIGAWYFNLTHGRVKLTPERIELIKNYDLEWILQ